MSASIAGERAFDLAGEGAAERATTGLALGWIAMLPLLAAYEWGSLATDGLRRNAGERLVFLALEPLGPAVAAVRWGVVLAFAVAAVLLTHARGARVRAGVARVVLEGAGLAVLLGPTLVLVLAALEGLLPRLDVSWDPGGALPALAPAALVFGGAAWEELCFRVGGYGLCFVVARVLLRALGAPERVGGALAEASGLAGSAVLFALAHLRAFTAWLGPGGAELDPALFTWLLLAGILLGLVFRLRGPGVAAWTHGLFNVALLVGVDPDVIL